MTPLQRAVRGETDTMGAMIRDGMPRPKAVVGWAYVDLPWVDPPTYEAMLRVAGLHRICMLAMSHRLGAVGEQARGQFFVHPEALIELTAWADAKAGDAT